MTRANIRSSARPLVFAQFEQRERVAGGMRVTSAAVELSVQLRSDVRTRDLPTLRAFYAERFRQDHPLLNDLLFDWYFRERRSSRRAETSSRWRIYLALDNGRIVGHIGAIQATLRARGLLFKAAWYINIFVVPEYTGAGIGSLLVQRGLADHDVVLGLGTTEQGLQLYRRNNYTLLGNLHRYMCILSADRATGLLYRPTPALGWLLGEAEARVTTLRHPNNSTVNVAGPKHFHVPLGYRDLWHRVSRLFTAVVDRSVDFMVWRYGANPDLQYQVVEARRHGSTLCGILVFRIDHADCSMFTPIVRIMDLIAEEDAVVPLLDAVQRHARQHDAALIEFFCSSGVYAPQLHVCGYVTAPNPLAYDLCRLYHPPRPTAPPGIPFSFSTRESARDLPLELMKSLEAWYVTLADSDLDRVQR